jgi:hypothetical protein
MGASKMASSSYRLVTGLCQLARLVAKSATLLYIFVSNVGHSTLQHCVRKPITTIAHVESTNECRNSASHLTKFFCGKN